MAHKELGFFDRFAERAFEARDVDRYAASFRRPPGKLCGEWTPRYCFDPWVMPLLHAAAPEAKLIVALRDPLARFVSGVSFDLARGERCSTSLIRQHLMRSSYVPQLEQIYTYFAPASVLVLQFEQMVADPIGVYQRTTAFLDVDDYVPRAANVPRNTARLTKWEPPRHLVDALRVDAQRAAPELKRLCPSLDLGMWPSCHDMGASHDPRQ